MSINMQIKTEAAYEKRGLHTVVACENPFPLLCFLPSKPIASMTILVITRDRNSFLRGVLELFVFPPDPLYSEIAFSSLV